MHFLTAAELRGVDARALDDLLERREAVVAFGDGELRGLPAAALLLADYAVLRRGATIALDAPEVWAGAVWRVGRRALLANAEEFVDEITDLDAGAWCANWLRGRSVLALDSAAVLIRSRGGDTLERAEFARLFAIGEPQTGLAAFLGKQQPQFRS
jgi:hypothetical protein